MTINRIFLAIWPLSLKKDKLFNMSPEILIEWPLFIQLANFIP